MHPPPDASAVRSLMDEALFVPDPAGDEPVEAAPIVYHSLDAPAPPASEESLSYFVPDEVAIEPPTEYPHEIEPESAAFDDPECINYTTPEEPPSPPIAYTLETLAPLELPAGTAGTLSCDHLRITGAAPHLVELLILSPAEHGDLLRDGVPLTGGDVFTQEDINRGKVRYRHHGEGDGRDSFTFATPDGELPATGFPFLIRPAHHAPELVGPGRLDGITEGRCVADLLAGMASSVMPNVEVGIALVATAGRGTWYYSRDDMRTWMEFDKAQHGRALLLASTHALRFEPRPGWSGTIKLTYRAWDGSTGHAAGTAELTRRDATGGATAFSKATASAVLPWSPPMPETPSCGPWEGTPTLAELFGDGAAVVRAEGPGQWQYSLDDGATWHPVGAVYHGRARLLRSTDRVRFVPWVGQSGKVILGARTWDGRSATPGGVAALAGRSQCGAGTPFGEYVQTRTWWLAE